MAKSKRNTLPKSITIPREIYQQLWGCPDFPSYEDLVKILTDKGREGQLNLWLFTRDVGICDRGRKEILKDTKSKNWKDYIRRHWDDYDAFRWMHAALNLDYFRSWLDSDTPAAFIARNSAVLKRATWPFKKSRKR